MPAKFLVGPRRPRSLRSLSRAHISSQNVTSANNYGIVKAGDGGNGGRGADGVGGKDSIKKEDAPINGTQNGTGGDKGTAGTAYLFNKEEKATNGKDGKNGNGCWGGLNLNKYEVSKTKTVAVSNRLCDYSNGVWLEDRDILQETIYRHATGTNGEASTNTIESKVVVRPRGYENPKFYTSYILYLNIHADVAVHEYEVNFDNMTIQDYFAVYWTGKISVKTNSGNLFPKDFKFCRYAYSGIMDANISAW